MSFKILYQDPNSTSHNLATIAVYVDAFAARLGLTHLNVNSTAFHSLVSALINPDFPHKDGVDKASPFKKAANFFVWFAASRPILDEFPEEIAMPELKRIPNHQNVIVPYLMAVDCLHGAEIDKKGKTVRLKNRIHVSKHFFIDLVETYSAATPVNDFKPCSLLFEQLAYKANPDAPYDEVI